jgi:hypothetical protein
LKRFKVLQTRDLVTFYSCHYVSCVLFITMINAIPKG